ncbi:MAG TPA: flagellar hook-associated protein FlgL [Stellaceae bacterium]|nr:flagellar hook-associated protein FlgL [Stellaceae bacterium]
MRISTNEFLLAATNDMLAQQSNVNQLNREIATGETMLSATADPSGASQAIGDASTIARFNYDTSNAQAATQSLQNGVSVLTQVGTVLAQLLQTAEQAANGTIAPGERQSLAAEAQGALQQLLQLANSQTAGGNYLFSGSKVATVPYSALPNGQVLYNGDASTNVIEIAPSLSVLSSLSGSGIFTGIPAGAQGLAVTAASSNSGGAYAVAESIVNGSQFSAAQLAGTQYAISFAAGPNGSLTYAVASGTGSPGSAGFTATSGVVASGSFTGGSDLVFGGVDIRINGTPAAGDTFNVQTNATTSMFQNVQNLVSTLQSNPAGSAANAQYQQQIQNVLANLGAAQNSTLSAQATLGSNLSEISAVKGEVTNLYTNAQTDLSNLQSANLPQVMANYSESLTALQAAQLAFAKVQNLTLFSFIH